MKIIKVKHCPKRSIEETFQKAVFKLLELGYTLDNIEYVSVDGSIPWYSLNIGRHINRPTNKIKISCHYPSLDQHRIYIVCMTKGTVLPKLITLIVEIDYDLF